MDNIDKASKAVANEKVKESKIVPQTRLAFLGYMLIIISMIVMAIITKSPVFAQAIAVNIIVMVIALYVLNCTVKGQCNIYAWIASYFVVIVGVFGSIMAIINLRK
jgi:hypothetical protein